MTKSKYIKQLRDSGMNACADIVESSEKWPPTKNAPVTVKEAVVENTKVEFENDWRKVLPADSELEKIPE